MVGFQPKDSYYRDQLQSRVYQEQLLAFAKDYFGRHTRVLLEIREGEGESLAGRKQRETEDRRKLAHENVRNHPAILEAKALFGGELGPIDIDEDGKND